MNRASDETLVRFLQWMLKRAEAGEINGVAVVTTQPSPDDALLGDTCWKGAGIEEKTAEVIGNLEILKSRIVEAQRHDFGSVTAGKSISAE